MQNILDNRLLCVKDNFLQNLEEGYWNIVTVEFRVMLQKVVPILCHIFFIVTIRYLLFHRLWPASKKKTFQRVHLVTLIRPVLARFCWEKYFLDCSSMKMLIQWSTLWAWVHIPNNVWIKTTVSLHHTFYISNDPIINFFVNL